MTIVKTINTIGGNVVVERLTEADEHGNRYAVHSPYGSERAATLDRALSVAVDMVNIISGFDAALDEFDRIAANTDGVNGTKYRSGNGYEFVIWISRGVPCPAPESSIILTTIAHNDTTYDGCYRFSMTLPYPPSC